MVASAHQVVEFVTAVDCQTRTAAISDGKMGLIASGNSNNEVQVWN